MAAVRFHDDLRQQLDTHRQLFRSLQKHQDFISVGSSYERLQQNVMNSARPPFLPEMDKVVAQITKFIRENQRTLHNLTTSIPQLDNDALWMTYQVGVRLADIERAARLPFDTITGAMHSMSPSATKLAREWDFDNGLSGAIKAAERAMQSITGIDRIWRERLPLADVFSQLMRSSALDPLPALRASAIAIQLPEFGGTFLGSLHQCLEELRKSGAEVGSAMAEVDSALNERADHLPHSWVTVKGMFDLFYPVLLAVLQLWYAKISDDQSSSAMRSFIGVQLRASETRLAVQIQSLKPTETRESISVVQRQCYLRVDRFTKAVAVGVLYPNQLIQVYRTSGKWAYVEFFDYANAIPKTGWILKKYVLTIHTKSKHLQH